AEMFPADNDKQEFSSKSTLLFPFFAQYLTDGVIRTIMPDTSEGDSDELRKKNTSNHWVDLCSLYGRNREQTLALRLLSEEPGKKGKLKSQKLKGEEFAPFLFDKNGKVKKEFEILDPVLAVGNAPPDKRKTIFAFGGDRANLSPMAAMLNTLFLREHNRLAGVLESENPEWDEERVFEVSRNIIIAMFLKIVIEEYLNHISSQSLVLRAYPSIAWTAPWNRPNWITTEFSLFYRWHGLVPANVTWNGEAIPIQETLFNNNLLIKRGLVGSFEEASSQPATKLKLRNMSGALAVHEERGINQGRLCELAPYTDYCEYFSLDRPQLWSDFSADPVVVDKLKELYDSPDHVEFYIGAFAGETTLNSPLSEFMLRLAAVDAFSQALNSPMLSEHVWNEKTFTKTGWDTIQNTSSLKDVVTRVSGSTPENFIGMTQPDWKREAPPSVLLTALKETFDLRKSKAGQIRLAAFVITTIAEAVGLIFWLNLVGQDRNFQGFLWLVGGEAVEWAALAYMIAKSPLSYPKKQGHVGRSLVTSGLTSLSEAFLWVGWLLLIPVCSIWWASLALLIAMHAKHVTEMT
ncbi:MAG: peroxidase family protein, partial [Pseudomonadota bacterium]